MKFKKLVESLQGVIDADAERILTYVSKHPEELLKFRNYEEYLDELNLNGVFDIPEKAEGFTVVDVNNISEQEADRYIRLLLDTTWLRDRLDELSDSLTRNRGFRDDNARDSFEIGDRVAHRWADEYNVGTIKDIREHEGIQYQVEWDYSDGDYVEWLHGDEITHWVDVNEKLTEAVDSGNVITWCAECGKKQRVFVKFPDSNGPFEDTEYECERCGAINICHDEHEYDEDGTIKESLNISDYEEVNFDNPDYRIYNRVVRDGSGKIIKGLWAAQKGDGEPFEITYEQARGFKPIDEVDELSRNMGKLLLPEERLSEDLEDDFKFLIAASDHKCRLTKYDIEEAADINQLEEYIKECYQVLSEHFGASYIKYWRFTEDGIRVVMIDGTKEDLDIRGGEIVDIDESIEQPQETEDEVVYQVGTVKDDDTLAVKDLMSDKDTAINYAHELASWCNCKVRVIKDYLDLIDDKYKKEVILELDGAINEGNDSNKCIICGEQIVGYGNNAEPVAEGRCCDDCNISKVIPARISQLKASRKEKDTITESAKKVKLEVKYETYGRYGDGGDIKTGRVSASTEVDALMKMLDHVHMYIDSDYAEEFKEENGRYPTTEEVTDELYDQNGDGCDLIYWIRNLITGEMIFDGAVEESEPEEWDDNIDYMLTENTLTDYLPPSIDNMLMDMAQMCGEFNYADVYRFTKAGVDDDTVRKLKNLYRRWNRAAEYNDEEKMCILAKEAAQIIGKVSLTENRNNPYFKPFGYRDAAKVINRKAPEYYYHLKEIEMDTGDGVKLARYAMRKGLPVMVDKNSDPDYPEFAIKGEYHWDDYFYPYPTAHEEALVAWDGKMFVEEQLTEASYDPYPAGKYGDLIFKILDSCSGDAIINFMHEYKWPFYESGDSISDVYDKINKYLDTHSGYGLWSDLDKYFN